MANESADDDKITRILGETVAAFLAAGAATTGPPAAAVVTAVAGPVLTEAFVRIASRVSSLRNRRCGEVYVGAARLAGQNVEELAEQVLSDESLLELFSRVLLAAQDMALDDNRRALSRSLAACALEPTPARISIGFLIETVMRDLHEAHIRFMLVLESEPRRPMNAPPGKYGLILGEIVERDPGLSDSSYPLLQWLLRYGLIEESTGGVSSLPVGKTYTLSALGQRILVLLRQDQIDPIKDYVAPVGL
jgi:hypothetical protein